MGPLAGTRIIEMKGLGPAPYAGMLLADLGAEVIVVERSTKPHGIGNPAASDPNARGKKSIALNLKSAEGVEALLKLVETADGLIEGFRPGVAERLGFGPDVCLQRNPKLVFGRMTGWGQTGPLAQAAGHDINYIALTGSLAAIGPAEKPVPPLNLVGDYAGGSMFLIMGMLAGFLHAKNTGVGQVIDAAIADGSASLCAVLYALSGVNAWTNTREANLLDGAAHFYDTYETLDGKFVSIGSLEPQFYALLVEKANVDPDIFKPQMDQSQWPKLKEHLKGVFKSKTRDEWCEIMEGTDVCFAPVLDYLEAPSHPHNQARNSYIEVGGAVQPNVAPRFSVSVPQQPSQGVNEGADTDSVLAGIGLSEDDIAALRASGAIPA